MPRRLTPSFTLLALLALLGAPGCGSGSTSDGQDRPLLVASDPAEGSVVPTGLTSVKLTWDEPVRLFLPYQVWVFRDDVFLFSRPFQLAGDADSVRILLSLPEAFSPGRYEVRALEGLVLNGEQHYALEPQVLRFEVSGTPAFFVGSPVTKRVTALTDDTLTAVSSTPTPGARDPVGLLAQRQGPVTRVFVQLATGAGTGKSLAHYLPGSGFMIESTLSTSGGDLVAEVPALALDPEGAFLYAAYRDVAAQQVRLARIRTADGVETGSLLLSVPALADTAPTALSVHAGAVLTLLVTARAGGQGFVSFVDAATFSEVDRDDALPGVQPAALGAAAGPSAVAGESLLVAPSPSATADLTALALADDTLTSYPAVQLGSSTALRVGYDGVFVLQGLAAGPLDELLAVRTTADLATLTPVDVTDDVGGVDQGATRVHALGQVPAQRRFYVLLDASCLARFGWELGGLAQEDLDPLTLGMQLKKLSGDAAGATCIGTVEGSVP